MKKNAIKLFPVLALVILLSSCIVTSHTMEVDIECEDFWDLDTADFAIIGGVIGYLEEEIEERKRLEREMEKEQKRIDDEMTECDRCTPSDEEPYP